MKYFDYAATTPIAKEAVDAMMPWLNEMFYNASSIYAGGREVRAAVEQARGKLAALLDADGSDIVFTSGGTEADNMALIGSALTAKRKGRKRIVVSAIEHHAVLESCVFLKELGMQVTYLPVNQYGIVAPEILQQSVDEDVALVSVMWVNNELGSIQDIPRLAQISHESGALFHTDAVQAVTTQPISFQNCGADLLSVSSHKIYGPKGCGALVIRKGTELTPFVHGGQQEGGRRGGTENVPGIVGFGEAAQLMKSCREEDTAVMMSRKRRMIHRLAGSDIRINSPEEYTAPSVLNVAFRNIEAEGLIFHLGRKGYDVAMGSACNSQSVEPSHVIQAIGLEEDFRRGCIRISFGHGQSDEDCDALVDTLLALAEKLKD